MEVTLQVESIRNIIRVFCRQCTDNGNLACNKACPLRPISVSRPQDILSIYLIREWLADYCAKCQMDCDDKCFLRRHIFSNG